MARMQNVSPCADADGPDPLQSVLLNHPDVSAAVRALPACEQYRDRFGEALELIYVFFVGYLAEDHVDHFL